MKFMKNNFKYFQENDSLNYEFIKAPKALFYDKKYASLSPSAKLLYLAMLERQSLSLKNSLKDDKGNIYIVFTHDDAREVLGCSASTVVKVFSELDCVKLIKRKHRGLCKPDLIYLNTDILKECGLSVNNLLVIESNSKNRDFKNKSSGNNKNNFQEVSKTEANNIKNNNNKINNIIPSYQSFDSKEIMIDRCEQKENIKFNIDYDVLIKSYPKDIIDEIVSVMTNAVCSSRKYITIGGESIPQNEVKNKLLSINQSHIEYVCDCLNRTSTNVKNINSYVLTCLWRAADNISIHYKLMVNHQKQEEKKSKTQNGFYS